MERDDQSVSLCRIVPSLFPTTVLEMEPLITVEPGTARRLTSQDCTAETVIRVGLLPGGERGVGAAASPSVRKAVRFAVCSEGNACDQAAPSSLQDTLRIRCPHHTNTAVSVTLAGPRFDARATPCELSAVLSGRFVAVGARVQACGAVYTVVQMGVRHGHGGVALVGAGCRISINDTATRGGERTLAGVSPCTTLVGLQKERQVLEDVFSLARASSRKSFGVLVHGPQGCGVRTLVDVALRSAAAAEGGCTVVPWSPSLDANLVRHRSQDGVVALVIAHCERYFGADGEEGDEDVAALAVRKLTGDVAALSESLGGNHCPAVVALALTHHLGAVSPAGRGGSPLDALFTVRVSLSLPDAADRAELLSSVRGVPPAQCMNEAHSLVGRSRAEVLAAGKEASLSHRLPFKPVRWADIGGLEEVKSRLHRALVMPQQHPETFARFGLTPPKGILLYGPPGCAKTTLVKALCSEGYFSLIYLDSASVLSAYVGESERLLRDVFTRAAQQAPCIVFFDEVEVIGTRRASGGSGGSGGGTDTESVRLLSTLLTEMDGFSATKGVCFVGATNAPHLIDDALLRPGRFDHLVFVPLPARADRERILSLFLQRTAADIAAIAEATEGFSGADLSALCSTALLTMDDANALDAPRCLQDRDWMTSRLLDHVARFKRTEYDTQSLEAFHRQHEAAA